MGKYIKLFFLICGVVLCVGCEKNDNKNDNTIIEKETSDNKPTEEETTYKNTDNAGDYFKNVNIVQDYDPNGRFKMPEIMITVDNDLMYSVIYDNTSGSNYLYVADIQTGVQMPLCSKIDCSHNNAGCNAYIGGTKDNRVLLKNISIIDNVIYIFGENIKTENYGSTSSEYFLMRINSDGSIREDLGTILTVYGDSKDTIKEDILFHRGFLYYAVGERKGISNNKNETEGSVTNKIYRYSIDGKGKPECVYDFSYPKGQGEADLNISIEAQGENLYVRQSVMLYVDNKMEYEEYKININTLEKQKIDTEINYCEQTERNLLLYINHYNVSGDIVTSEINTQLEYEEQCRMQKMSFYDNATKEIKELTEEYLEDDEWFTVNDFWVTDKYICLNARKINDGKAVGTYIFDFEWNLVKKLDDIDYIDHCFGEYILWNESDNDIRHYYIARLEDCISENKKYGKICNINQTGTGGIVDMNRYIYEN